MSERIPASNANSSQICASCGCASPGQVNVKVDVSSIFHVPKNDEKASSLESLPQAALATTPVTRAINKVLALLTLLVLLAFGAPLPSVRAWLGIVDLLKI